MYKTHGMRNLVWAASHWPGRWLPVLGGETQPFWGGLLDLV